MPHSVMSNLKRRAFQPRLLNSTNSSVQAMCPTLRCNVLKVKPQVQLAQKLSCIRSKHCLILCEAYFTKTHCGISHHAAWAKDPLSFCAQVTNCDSQCSEALIRLVGPQYCTSQVRKSVNLHSGQADVPTQITTKLELLNNGSTLPQRTELFKNPCKP